MTGRSLPVVMLVLLGASGLAQAQQWIDPATPWTRPSDRGRPGGGVPNIGGQGAPPPESQKAPDIAPSNPQPTATLQPYALCLTATHQWCTVYRLDTREHVDRAASVLGSACRCGNDPGVLTITYFVQ
jgi:hypothetical protein